MGPLVVPKASKDASPVSQRSDVGYLEDVDGILLGTSTNIYDIFSSIGQSVPMHSVQTFK